MKKLILIMIILLCFLTGCVAALPEAPEAAAETAVYKHWRDFVAANPSRTLGTDGEKEAADYLKSKFESFGYEAEARKFEFLEETESQNVIAKKPSVNAKQVIIGAHYDSYGGGEGAFDNGSGIAVLLTLAEKLFAETLPFDVVFVAFGAEELGLYGSERYVSQMSKAEKDSTLLMINIDVVGFGDFNYVYGEDVSNPQEKFFVEISKNLPNPVRKMPAGKGSVIGGTSDHTRPYYNTGHATDGFAFLKAGIPCATFFSGNLSSGYFGYVQTINAKNGVVQNVMHTKDDTVKYVEDNFKDEFCRNLETVTTTIFNGITDENFTKSMENARKSIISAFWFDRLFSYLILLGLAVLVALSGFTYYRKLQKKTCLAPPEIRQRTVQKPPAEDVFGDF